MIVHTIYVEHRKLEKAHGNFRKRTTEEHNSFMVSLLNESNLYGYRLDKFL